MLRRTRYFQPLLKVIELTGQSDGFVAIAQMEASKGYFYLDGFVV